MLDIQFIGPFGIGQLFYIPSCDSTQLELQRFVQSGAMGLNTATIPLAIYTDEQTHGRGQRGNQWLSESGKNVMFTICLPLRCNVGKLGQDITYQTDTDFVMLNKALASAVAQVLSETIHSKVEIKWPNDLIVMDKKLGGLLMEVVTILNQKYLFLGVGINVNQTEFEDQPLATSLLFHRTTEKNVSNGVGPCFEIQSLVLQAAERITTAWNNQQSYALDYIDRLYLKEQNIVLHRTETDEKIHCKLMSVNDVGQIGVELPNREIVYFHHGDVKMEYRK